MLAEGKQFSNLEEECTSCLSLARSFVSKLTFPLSELPSELLITPLQLRNNCNNNSNIIEENSKDYSFSDSVKKNVKSNVESNVSLYQIPSKFTKEDAKEDSEQKIEIIESNKLDSESCKLRQEIITRIFVLFEIYIHDKKQTKKQKQWKSRKIFVKELLKWLHPLSIYMDTISAITRSNYFQEFILSLSNL